MIPLHAIKNEGSPDIVKYYKENHFADISIQMSEGPLFRVSSIEWRGLEKDSAHVVQRELQLGSGDVIEEEKLNEQNDASYYTTWSLWSGHDLNDRGRADPSGVLAQPETFRFQKRVIISVY